jgi:hypothetical protein
MRLDRIVIALALLGCGEPVTPAAPVDETQLRAHVTSLAASYHPHDPAIARITNLSEVTIYENLCAGEIEGFGYVPGEWNASFGTSRFCYDYDPRIPGPNYRAIPPGASVLDTLSINGQAYAGQWRFQFDLRDADGDLLPLDQRVSAPFLVVR